MNLLRRIPWYWWLLLPGGAVVALVVRSKKAAAAAPAGANIEHLTPGVVQSNIEAQTISGTENLVDSAKAQADTLRASLANDPLAASLLGISPSLITKSDPTTVTANAAKAADLQTQINNVQSEIAAAYRGWADGTHFGGQSPAQFQAIIDGYNAQLASLQSQLAQVQ